VQVLKGDGERGDANMTLSVMCKKINEVGNDRSERERWKILGKLAIAGLKIN